MSKQRKPIPQPMSLPTFINDVESDDDKYPVPFVLANGPRMILDFLANHSALPESYRRVIANILLVHNEQLANYLIVNYGMEGAADANVMAQNMAAGFLGAVAEEREAADKDMFQTLDREVFGE